MKYNNTPCYCGSGIKFKKCHQKLKYMVPAATGEIGNLLANWTPVHCMHHSANADCTPSIRAHSVPKAHGLSPLAKDGHVLSFFPFNKFISEKIEAKKIGVNRASIFNGFCSSHDVESFLEADKLSENSMIGFSQNIYRSFIFEKFKKINAIRRLSEAAELIKRGKDYEEQKYIHDTTMIQIKGQKGGCEILDYHIRKILHVINENKSPYGFCIKAKGIPLIAMSASYSPEYNINGIKIHNLSSDSPDKIHYISILSFYKNGYNYFMMGSADESLESADYLRSAFDGIMKNYYIGIQLAFNYCENVYFSESFYDNHDENEKEYLKELALNIHANLLPFKPVMLNPLKSHISAPEVVFYNEKV